ncbi:peptidyl-tRNA hydrolase PTH2-domain-containing protein [Irpex rosettiformis]|uniref:Peptidyl-tRNA hydrolase PTH2-domain-containing protein n=1 Tax=Irpex rosettiformis TaxID=378272 RepID=A0ACB8TUK0_9APHY|nr:peptidyl-tRNA hydrolase PTH2-domain-containing protein [Irpex rosettiformis]
MSSSTSTLLTSAALVASSLAIGYAVGYSSRSAPTTQPKETVKDAEESASTTSISKQQSVEEEYSDSEEEEAADGDLSAVKPGFLEPCKLVLVVRTDLKMTSGKIAAQCGHATLACYKALVKTNPKLLQHWERTGQAKVALKASSEDELLELEAIAKSLNLCARSIQDAGRTQIAAGSRTVLGIGPGPVELINRVTGKLRLL